MQEKILDELLRQELIAPEDAEKIKSFQAKKPFSLHWELKTLLYLGVLLLNSGLSFLVYQNIDTIGHAVIIGLIGCVSAACFWYAIYYRRPFSRGEVTSPTPYYDYVLLLGCLAFLLMESYWQFQYKLFGERYGLATFIPMVLFFGLAYWLDNRGVLSLGITALASWLGVTIATNDLLTKNDFDSPPIVHAGVFLGALLCVVTFVSERSDLKKHFSLTYLNFGVHILMISCLAGMIALERPAYYFPMLGLAVAFFMWYAFTRHSFYFLIVAVIYAYIGVTYLLMRALAGADAMFYLLYFIASCAAIIVFLANHKRFFQKQVL